MLPSAEVEILREGVTLEGQPLEPKKVLQLSSLTPFDFDNRRLVVSPQSNNIEFACLDLIGDAFYPEGYEPKGSRFGTRWEMSIGDPNKAVEQRFGRPPVLDAKFLGHPLRDVLSPLLDGQALPPLFLDNDDRQPVEVNYQYHPYVSDKECVRKVIFASPIYHTGIIGFYKSCTSAFREGKRPESFLGKVRILGEVEYIPPDLDFLWVRFSAITQADSDSLIRVSSKQTYIHGNSGQLIDFYSKSLARISVLLGSLPENWDGIKWSKEGLPLDIIDDFKYYLDQSAEEIKKERPTSYVERFAESEKVYGFHILREVKGISDSEVSKELWSIIHTLKSIQ